MVKPKSNGSREQTLEFLVGKVNRSEREIEVALDLYGYSITDKGRITALDEIERRTTQMPRAVVIEALSSYFTHLSEASDNLPATIPLDLESFSPGYGGNVDSNESLDPDWDADADRPNLFGGSNDYIDELFQKKTNWGKRILVTGAVLVGLAGAFALGDYNGTSRTEASNSAEIAELKKDNTAYESRLNAVKGAKTRLEGELTASENTVSKISTENAELFGMVEELEGHISGSQSLVDQEVELDICYTNSAACSAEKDVVEASCNARVAGLQEKVGGAVVSVPAACDCETLTGQITDLQEERDAFSGLMDDYEEANTNFYSENQELKAKVLELDGKFAGLEFDLEDRQIDLDSCDDDYAGCMQDKKQLDHTWIARDGKMQSEREGLKDELYQSQQTVENLESQFVVNPYQQITTILDGPEEERANGLKDLVINYLGNRTVGRKMIVEGNDCNTALGNLYDAIVGDTGDMDESARAGFVTYVPQICGNLDPDQNQVEFALKK
jgi:hypothetical protein